MPIPLGSAYGKIILDATGVAAGVASARASMAGLRGAMATASASLASVGMALTKSVTLPLVGIGVVSAKTAADFEAQMNILEVAARSSGTAMDDLREAAIQAGADTELVGVSASDAADAMTNFYKAGLDTTEIFGDLQGYLAGTASLGGALRSSIDLAAASELDLAQASDLVAISMKTFGLGAEDAGRIANSFVQSADASVANVGELYQAMVNVGPTAVSMGMSLEETNTALALLSERGIRGAEAGTALKSMLMNITRPTKKVQDTLEMLNVSLYDTEGQMKPLPTIIGELSDALYGQVEVTETVGGRTDEQNRQLELAQRAYDQATDAIYKHNAGLKVLSDKQLAKYIEQQQAASQEIKRLNGIRGDTITVTKQLTEEERNQAAVTLAGSYGIKAFNTLIGEGAEGWAAMEEQVANAATAQESAAARTKGFKAALEQLQGSLEALLIQVGTPLIENFLTPLAQTLTDVAGRISEQLDPKMAGLAVTVGLVAAAAGPLLTVLGALISPVGLVAAAVAGLGYAWQTNFMGFKDWTIEAWAVVQPVLQQIWNWLSVNVPAALQTMQTVVQSVLAAVQGWWDAHGEQVIGVLQGIWNWLSVNVPAALQTMQTVVQSVLAAVQGWWDAHGAAVMTIVRFLWDTVQTVFQTAVTVVQTVVSTALALIQSFWQAHGEAVMTSLRNTWALVQTLWQGAVDRLTLIIEAFAAAINGDWRTFGATMRQVWDSAWNDIKAIFTTAKDNLIAIGKSLVVSIKNVFTNTDWGAVGKGIIDGIVSGVKNGVGALVDAVKAAAGAALDAAKGFLGIESPSKVFRDVVGKNIDLGIAAGIRGFAGVPMEEIKSLSRGMQSAFVPAMAMNMVTDNRQWGGDTFYVTNSDAGAVEAFRYFLEQRRERQLNEFMGG